MTAGLTGAALAGAVPLVLPVLIAVAFGQYVFDSYLVHRQKRLRMSTIGRWNGIGYFVPLVVIAARAAGGRTGADGGVDDGRPPHGPCVDRLVRRVDR